MSSDSSDTTDSGGAPKSILPRPGYRRYGEEETARSIRALTPFLNDRVEALAKALRVSKREIVQHALEYYFEADEVRSMLDQLDLE